MKNIYVVRHCKADGQAPNAGLTESGVRQAEELATIFMEKEIDCILSSPYERAVQTIKPLADQLGIEVELDHRLAERVLSSENHPDWRDRLRHTYDDLDLCYEGGESSSTAINRAVSVVLEALDREKNNIIVVSHGNLISLLLKYFDDRIGFKEWEALSNPDIFHFTFSEDTPVIRRIWTE
ncbi:histidine phosphatase family protein [Paenibacillus lupini]|uniref:histidine phosphatase family protein n=1 Tax=Paenibacillus lupini TaxID=1450204 RepID=UPI00141E0FF8|nr:histidine phosphatase family protein [Paenibacillus lupini]NIK23494.1 2,3-bisphosphoglycerate-dependent phosphoglycerate mutase [Paenibacillus lupini]